MKWLSCALVAYACLGIANVAIAQPPDPSCDQTTRDNTFQEGVDYNDGSRQARERVAIVEKMHFTPDVAALRRGSSASIQEDLDYTLRHIPNHYPALAAYARWESENPRIAVTRPRSADCYFQRAISFRPGDARLRALYGVVLHRVRRHEDALKQYQAAEGMGLGSADLFYNRGLLEFDLGNYAAAEDYAERAYALGYPLPGLRSRLERHRSSSGRGNGEL